MKKLFVFLFLAPLLLAACTSNYQAPTIEISSVGTTTVITTISVVTPKTSVVQTPKKVITPVSVKTVTPTPELSNDNYYTNSVGNEVHSPAKAPSIPPGASAICGDGTYSFSQSRRGTCSHHGGVSQWLN